MKKAIKIVSLLLAAALLLSFTACSGSNAPEKEATDPAAPGADAVTYKIGLCNYVDDASLNQIVGNIKTQLAAIGKENNVNFEITDEMDNTLIYREIFGVYIGRKMSSEAKISDIEALKQIKTGGYTAKVSEDGHSFTVSFGKSGISALNALTEDSACYVVFGTEITEEAVPGTAMTNEPWYEIGNHTGKHRFDGNKTEEYTYGISSLWRKMERRSHSGRMQQGITSRRSSMAQGLPLSRMETA